MKLRELVEEMQALKTEIDDLKEVLAEKQKRYDQLRRHEIPDAMDALGVDKITFEGIGTVFTTPQLQVSVRDMPMVVEKLKEMGHEEMVKETVHPSTLKAFIKELVQEGEEVPFDESLVATWFYDQATIRKG